MLAGRSPSLWPRHAGAPVCSSVHTCDGGVRGIGTAARRRRGQNDSRTSTVPRPPFTRILYPVRIRVVELPHPNTTGMPTSPPPRRRRPGRSLPPHRRNSCSPAPLTSPARRTKVRSSQKTRATSIRATFRNCAAAAYKHRQDRPKQHRQSVRMGGCGDNGSSSTEGRVRVRRLAACAAGDRACWSWGGHPHFTESPTIMASRCHGRLRNRYRASAQRWPRPVVVARPALSLGSGRSALVEPVGEGARRLDHEHGGRDVEDRPPSPDEPLRRRGPVGGPSPGAGCTGRRRGPSPGGAGEGVAAGGPTGGVRHDRASRY